MIRVITYTKGEKHPFTHNSFKVTCTHTNFNQNLEIMKIKSVINGTVVLGIFIGAVLFNGCQDRNKKNKLNNQTPPESTISYEEANRLEENYKRYRYQFINKAIGYEDTREVHFSLKQIKEYIEYVERETEGKGFENLGLRVYFGVYPPKDKNKDSLGLSTVFIVPTATNAKDVESNNKNIISKLVLQNQNITSLRAENYGGGGQTEL